MCLRQLTTYSLWQAGCFKKLGKVSDLMREFYSPSEYHLGIGMYQNYNVLQKLSQIESPPQFVA